MFAPLLIMALSLAACNTPSSEASTGPGPDTTVVKTAEAAFVFALPLALMDITRKKLNNYETPVDGKGAPVNQLMISSQFPNADFREVVRPNADTYYNTGMLDLSTDAMVLSLPNTNGRYYLMPMLDAWTNVFAAPGKRTTGTGGQILLITGPRWTGSVPPGMKQVKSPTDMVWILGRFQVNSAEDGAKVVVPLEKKVTLTPLAAYGSAYVQPKGTPDPNLNPASPNAQIEHMPIDSFFNYVNQLMTLNPPAAADSPALASFARLGIGPGATFHLASFDSATRRSLQGIAGRFVTAARNIVVKGLAKPINGWSIAFKDLGDYKTYYSLRAVVAYAGLGANLPEDAIYPSCAVDADGNKFDGAHQYVLHFDKGQAPPVNAFWSLTMYDNDGYFVHNPLNRFAIGDRSNLKANADGSFDIYIQNVSPGKARESNWLPSPPGGFNLLLRMYWPKEAVINGSWTPPAVKRTN